MTNCPPQTAWEMMKRGHSLRRIAHRYGDTLRDLDRAIWSWRTTSTGSHKPAGRTSEQSLALHRLAHHDPLAARAFQR